MARLMTVHELQVGDVVLYHSETFIGKLIRLFDQGTYSHAAIYDGTWMVEALERGVTTRNVYKSFSSEAWVDCYRFVSDDGHKLGEPGYEAEPVQQVMQHYLDEGDRYGYEQIVLLALMCSTRRLPVVGWIPGLSAILRTIIDSAADLIAEMLDGGREPMICSELVYRCYCEAGNQYCLDLEGMDEVKTRAVENLTPRSKAVPKTGLTLDAHYDMESDHDLQEAQIAVKSFMKQYMKAKKGGSEAARAARSGRAGMLGAPAVPDFVTPRDLEFSPNLYKVGRIILPPELRET